jgi:hypothetical protein
MSRSSRLTPDRLQTVKNDADKHEIAYFSDIRSAAYAYRRGSNPGDSAFGKKRSVLQVKKGQANVQVKWGNAPPT